MPKGKDEDQTRDEIEAEFEGLFYIRDKIEFERKADSFLREHPEYIVKQNFQGQTLLHAAAYHGSILMLNKILESLQVSPGKSFNMSEYLESKDFLGWTPLFTAVANCQWLAVWLLKNSGANLFATDKYSGDNIFHTMVKNDDWLSVLVLITNAKDGGIVGDGKKIVLDFDISNKQGISWPTFAKESRSYKVLWALKFLGYYVDSLMPPQNDIRIRREKELFLQELKLFMLQELVILKNKLCGDMKADDEEGFALRVALSSKEVLLLENQIRRLILILQPPDGEELYFFTKKHVFQDLGAAAGAPAVFTAPITVDTATQKDEGDGEASSSSKSADTTLSSPVARDDEAEIEVCVEEDKKNGDAHEEGKCSFVGRWCIVRFFSKDSDDRNSFEPPPLLKLGH